MAIVHKMPVTTLQGKTARQVVKSIDDIDDGFINHTIGQFSQGFLFLLLESWIIFQFPGFNNCLQVLGPDWEVKFGISSFQGVLH